MSKTNIKTVTIEATDRADALRQLREVLGDSVPNEILEALANRIDEDEPAGEFVVPEINSFGDMIAAVEAIGELPKGKQHEALEAVILKLAEPFGFDREHALAIANRAKDNVLGRIEAAGIPVNPEHKRPFGEVSKAAQDTAKQAEDAKPTVSKRDAIERIMEGVQHETKRGFEVALKKLKAAGYSDEAICHIGQFFKAQDPLVDSLAAIFHLADSQTHGDLHSARLFQHISNYLKTNSEMVYGMLEHAGVDPETVGFGTREEYNEKLRKVAHIDERVAKTVYAAEPARTH